MDGKFTIGNKPPSEGWFNIQDVVLSRTVADPNDPTDKRNENNQDGKINLQLDTRVSKAGDYGQFIHEFNPIWHAEVERCVTAKTIVKGNRRVVDLLQLNMSADNKYEPGAKIEDPIMRFKIDFSEFSVRHPNKMLRGKPKTQFFDFDTEYLDERGVKQYLPATVADPISGEQVPVNTNNIHLFATEGSIIRSGRIMMTGVAVTKNFISMPATAQRIVLERAVDAGFSDEPEPVAANAAMRAHAPAAVAPGGGPIIAPVVVVPPVVVPPVNEHDAAAEPAADADADLEGIIGDL